MVEIRIQKTEEEVYYQQMQPNAPYKLSSDHSQCETFVWTGFTLIRFRPSWKEREPGLSTWSYEGLEKVETWKFVRIKEATITLS
jgi:hypothetical protein